MPVTKTAKRALRGAERKLAVNKLILKRLEVAVRSAKKAKSREKILGAISLADRAAKKRAIHKNKAARIKSSLSKLLPRGAATAKKKASPKPKKGAKPSKK
jgi:ribosomal protein S20